MQVLYKDGNQIKNKNTSNQWISLNLTPPTHTKTHTWDPTKLAFVTNMARSIWMLLIMICMD